MILFGTHATPVSMQEVVDVYPEAYKALPECYQADSCLSFFVDINGHLACEYDLGGEYYWTGKAWVEIKRTEKGWVEKHEPRVLFLFLGPFPV